MPATNTKNRPAAAARPKATFDHLKKKKPLEHTEWIPLDDDVLERFTEAKDELDRAKLLDEETRLARAQEAFDEAKRDLQDNSVKMVFRAIGRSKYDELMREFPPSEEQVEEHKAKYGVPPEYDAEAFAPYLIAATCAEPVMTPEQVKSLIDEYDWNGGEYAVLFNAALRVNTGRRVADLAF